jgi:hypothetical protein
MADAKNTPFSSGFFTILQNASPVRQQLMALENKFCCHFFPRHRANCHESHSNSGSKTALLRHEMKNETPLLTVPSRSSLKKHAFYGILAMVSLLALGMTQSARANLVTNGDFETGDFTGWTQSGNTGFTGVSGTFAGVPPHGGANQAFFGPVGSHGFITQDVATTAGGSYVIEFSLHNFGGTPSYFSVNWDGASIYSVTDSVGFDYATFSVIVFASSALTALQFEFQQDPSYFLLDDISVNRAGSVPDAGSTLPLLGFALAGLGILRRKLRC